MTRMTLRAATTDKAVSATIYIAIELSGSKWVIGVHTPLADKISIYRLTGGDAQGLLKLIAHVREKVERRLGRSATVLSCYEAGYDGFWLHRLLKAHGICNHVLDSASIQVSRRARRVKTDRIDAEGLIRVLMAYDRGERQVCAIVRVPSLEDEDAKRLHRERERLVRERVQHTNRIHGLLATQADAQGLGEAAGGRVYRRWSAAAAAAEDGDPARMPTAGDGAGYAEGGRTGTGYGRSLRGEDGVAGQATGRWPDLRYGVDA